MINAATQTKRYPEPPFQVTVIDAPEIQKHNSAIRLFAGKPVTVKKVIETKKGLAFQFRTSFGTLQILERFTCAA